MGNHQTARFTGQSLTVYSRRSTVKRMVYLQQASGRSTVQHLCYVEREGVDRQGGQGRAYGAIVDEADTAAFEERGRGDRHQFRFIVSQGFITCGMRERAMELATEWLGPRTELEIQSTPARHLGRVAGKGLADLGFGSEVKQAMQQRVILVRNLLGTLRSREMAQAAKDIAAETGLEHRPVADGQRVAGIYRRSVMLASGRYPILDDGMGYSMVPWKPVIEPRLGQRLAATVRGGGTSWEMGRQHGPTIG